MTLMVPCPHCPDGFNGPTRTNTSVCKTCGGTHQVPARTGETREASFDPSQDAAPAAPMAGGGETSLAGDDACMGSTLEWRTARLDELISLHRDFAKIAYDWLENNRDGRESKTKRRQRNEYFSHIHTAIYLEQLRDMLTGSAAQIPRPSATPGPAAAGDGDLRIAQALRSADWAGVSIGNKALISAAIAALARSAPQAPAASAGGDPRVGRSYHARRTDEARAALAPTAKPDPASREEIAGIIRKAYMSEKSAWAEQAADAILAARPVADGDAAKRPEPRS